MEDLGESHDSRNCASRKVPLSLLRKKLLGQSERSIARRSESWFPPFADLVAAGARLVLELI